MKIIVVFFFIKLYTLKNYYVYLKNPQNFNKDINYGVLGGTIGSYLTLNRNEFMVSFWFKYNNFWNKIFPLMTIYENNRIIKEYNFYKNIQKWSSKDEFSKNISIKKEIAYFSLLKVKLLSNGNLKIILKIFSDVIESNYVSNSNINEFIFILNRLNLNEDLIIENLIFYDCIDCFTDLELIEGVSNIIYFINFKFNYPNTKWFMNEIDNEFGPSLNGNNNDFINMFTADFNDVNYEIEWKSSGKANEINFNPVLINYIYQFEVFFSICIVFNFDLYWNKIGNLNQNKYSYDIINYFDNKFRIEIDVNTSNNDVEIFFNHINNFSHKFNIISKKIVNPTLVNGKNFIEGSFFEINFLYVNIFKRFDQTYNINNSLKFKNNSFFCKTTNCFYHIYYKFSGDFKYNNKILLINLNNDINDNLIFLIYLKEFILGTGRLNFDYENSKLKIESKNKIKPFLIFNENYNNLERRNNFNLEETHKICSHPNCSICRKDLKICEYCRKNYYLSSGNCILNTNNLKFVNNYSQLVNKDYEKMSYNNYSISSLKYYKIQFNISSISSYYLFDILIYWENKNLENIILDIFSENCKNKFNFFYNIVEKTNTIFNIVIAFKDINCINELLIYNFNNNDLVNFKIKISKENVDCNNNYKDILCSNSCNENNSYFIKFNNSLFYSSCYNTLNNNTKNKSYFKYYSKCPYHCNDCDINSDYNIKCVSCDKGYILKNGECILKLIINCNIEPDFNINNNNTDLFLYNCNNICNYLGNNSQNENFLVKTYNNKNNCNINDNIILNCNNNNKFYDYNEKKCKNCINNNCINLDCINLNFINNFCPCSNGYQTLNYKCILDQYFDLNCKTYELDIYLNLIVCKSCKENFYLNYDNYICNKRNTDKCSIYNENSYICKNCINGYFLNYLKNCEKCGENCLDCIYNTKNCISCKFGYDLIINKCLFNKIYQKNCKLLSITNFCLVCNDGYYLNELKLCVNCNYKCIKCLKKNYCSSCKNNFMLINNECINRIQYCVNYKKNDYSKCEICLKGYYLNDNFICKRCHDNCLFCKINSKNCTSCKSEGILIKDIIFNYCKYNCKNDNYYFYKNDLKCIKCEINFFKEFKLYEKSFKFNEKELEIFKDIDNKYKYFVIFDIPNYLNKEDIDDKNLKNYFELKLNNTYSNFDFIMDLNNNKTKILIIPEINNYLKSFSFDIKIKTNIFSKFKNCIFKEKIFKFNIKNYNIQNFENEILINTNKNYPTYKNNSSEYNIINKTNYVVKTTTDSLIIGTFILSIFSPSILSKLSIFLPTLLFFNYITLLKIKFDKKINTILSLIDFNPRIIDISFYINLDKKKIKSRIEHLIIMNTKLLKIKLLLVNNMTLNYILLNLCLLIIFLLYLIENFINIIKLIIYFFILKKKNYKKIINIVNHNKKWNLDMYTVDKKGFVINLSKKLFIKKITMKIILVFKKIRLFTFYYFYSFFVSELPNIILFILVYSSTINKDFFTIQSSFINILWIYNTILISFFFIKNLFFIKITNKKGITDNDYYDKILKYFIPYYFILNKKEIIKYYKIFEILRIIWTLLIIFYLSYNIYLQIVLILIFQIIFLYFLIISLTKNFNIIILFCKELFIFLFLISIFINLFNNNYLLNNIILIMMIITFILSILEFCIYFYKQLFNLILKFKTICLKKRNNKIKQSINN